MADAGMGPTLVPIVRARVMTTPRIIVEVKHKCTGGWEKYILIRTSPGPGSGVSRLSTLTEIWPGTSYTAALYCFGISTAADAMVVTNCCLGWSVEVLVSKVREIRRHDGENSRPMRNWKQPELQADQMNGQRGSMKYTSYRC